MRKPAWTPIERLWQDTRYGMRLLRKNPGFTAAAVVTLAIGIGANAAIFSITDAVLLRPLPYPNSNRLIRIWQNELRMGEGHLGAAPPEFIAYRDRTRAFSDVAGYQEASFDVTGEGEPEHIFACRATANLFSTLRASPMLGRTFAPQEELFGARRVVVLSYAFWRGQFAGDAHVIGKMIRLNERGYEIVGVMPEWFTFPSTAATPGEPPALWAPLSFTSDELNDWASSFDTSMIARLRPGVSLAQAQDDVKRVAAQFQREHPDIYSGNVRLEGMAEPWAPQFGPHTRIVLSILIAAVTFVLFIACANVANLLLARAGAREREISIRRALGASAGRLTRQALLETAILTIGGGALACALAYALIRMMNTLSLTQVKIASATLDTRVLLFTFAICGLTSLLCGLAPAWAFRSSRLHDALKQSGRQSGPSRATRRFGQFFIVVQMACCVVLLVGSSLLLRSFLRVLETPLGFDPYQTLIVRTTFNSRRYSPDRRRAVERTIEARLSALPEVSDVALTTHLPLADERRIGFVVDGRPPDEFHWANNALASDDYFRTMRIPLLRGRTFSGADSPQAPLAAVINETMARQYWPQGDPVGKGLKWGNRHMIIIGIVSDVHVDALDKPVLPMIYNSAYQIDSGASTSGVFIVRAKAGLDAMALAASAKRVIRSVDAGVPIVGFTTLQQVVSASLAIRRVSLGLVGAFALIALLLSVIGIYGVLSHAVAQRVPEIGVRVAVGANAREITALILGEGASLALWGILIGIALGAVAARSIASLLFGVRALDAISFSAGVLLLFTVALLASYLPARRAARVDPMIALRFE